MVRHMTTRDRKSYEAARDALKAEGCRSGGYKLAADGGDHYPLCCRHLSRAWRLFSAYPSADQVVIVALLEHTPGHNPAFELSRALPNIFTVGRRRTEKPPCCDTPEEPPEMNRELSELLGLLAD